MITTNTGAKKLESSDNWREIFPNPGTGAAGAHNASVDAQDRIQAEVATIINGKRCGVSVAAGNFVLLRNSTITGKEDGAYVAAKAIPANTDLDSTYLGNAITGGISNVLNGNKADKSTAIQLTALSSGWSSGVQTISATGVTVTNNIMVGAGSLTDAQFEEMTNAQIMCISQGTDSITLKHFGDTPTIDLPIVVIILG